MAAAMPPNRFAVPVQATILRRIGWRSTNERPSAMSARSLPGRARRGRFFRDPDSQQGQDRDGVGDRVHGHGAGRADQSDQGGPQARPRHLSERLGCAQLAVTVDQVLLRDQDRQVALVGHVEEDGAHSAGHRHRVQLAQGEHAECGGHRHRPDDQGPGRVAPDHQPPLGVPVHDRAGRQGDERERKRGGRGEQPDLEGGGLQDDDRGQRQREPGDGRTHLADRLPAPQQQEVAMPPERAALVVPRHGFTLPGRHRVVQPRREGEAV